MSNVVNFAPSSATCRRKSGSLWASNEWIAAATPLYHGVALVRGAVLDRMAADWLLHVAYLVAFLAATSWLAYFFLRRRLVK